MPDEMEAIIAEFVAEAEETLDAVEPLFVKLETNGNDGEIVNRIFRSVHTIKGAAGFLGFQSVVDVAHNAENIMKKVREGAVTLSKPLADVVLKSVDMLRLLFRHIRDGDGVVEDIAPLVAELKGSLEQAPFPPPKDEATKQAGGPEKTAAVVGPDERGRPAAIGPQDASPPPAQTGAQAAAAPERGGEPAPAGAAQQGKGTNTLRVEVGRLDRVLDLTGEVVLVRNRLLNIVNRLDRRFDNDSDVDTLHETVSFLDLITSDMQLGVMKMRMQPLEKVFSKFPRLVRDLAGQLGKAAELVIAGEETEVDKSVIEHIGDPLVHIIRNSVDHGLEPPEERRAGGKPEKGRIAISASQKGNQIVIEVSDDGRGIDIQKVKRKAVEKRLITQDSAESMTDEAVINIIFLPGFSTAEVATEMSGRGVGMDVVKTNISRLNGSVEVVSAKGAGTTFIIRIPLTLAIIQTLMVAVGGSRYAVPLAPVEESIMISEGDLSAVGGVEALVLRDKMYPLFDLAGILGERRPEGRRPRYAIVVSLGDRRFCLGVDDLFGQEEIVIKTVSGVNASSSFILGATITGDGKVVFVLDLALISKSTVGSAAA